MAFTWTVLVALKTAFRILIAVFITILISFAVLTTAFRILYTAFVAVLASLAGVIYLTLFGFWFAVL